MLRIDERIPKERIAQFATQAPLISKEIQLTLDEMFVGDQGRDFEEGVAAGLAAAHQLMLLQNGHDYVAAALAMASKRLHADEAVEDPEKEGLKGALLACVEQLNKLTLNLEPDSEEFSDTIRIASEAHKLTTE